MLHGCSVSGLQPFVLDVDPVDRAAAAALDRMTQQASEAKVPFNWEELKQDRDTGRA